LVIDPPCADSPDCASDGVKPSHDPSAGARVKRGEAKAIGATPARHPRRVLPHRPRRCPFRELGPDWQRKRYSPEHRARRLQRQIEALGYTVSEEEPTPAV